ncbi:MAG: Holliday junction branch migration protein RuvA [Acidimicrobiales bacterium]
MIGSLRGVLLDRSPRGEVLIEAAGVGYRAMVTPATWAAVGELGGPAFLYVHTHVREDEIALYGFATAEERDAFEALIGAHGVGPALGLAILAVHSPAALRRILTDEDLDGLTQVPGVGRKTAARLLIDLKNRLDSPCSGVSDGLVPGEGGDGFASARGDVRAALTGLGYEPDEVRGVLAELPDEGELDTLLREALRRLAASR